MPDIKISLEGDNGAADTRKLYRWLRADPDVFPSLGPTLRSMDAPPGSMGPLEIIHIVVENGEDIAALITAMAVWYQTLRGRPVLRWERDGQVHVIENASPEELRRILWGDADTSGSGGPTGTEEGGGADGARR